jgi:HAD superfamily hydrolase (TIGR01509 family)
LTQHHQGPLHAIVFDLDGVLVDSEPLSRQAWAEIMAEYGHQMDDATYGRLIGLRSDESAQIVIEAYTLPLTAAELLERKGRAFEAIWRHGLPAMPGVEELFATIERRAIPWAVATSSPRRYAWHILAYLGLAERCRAVAGGDEVARGKPAPDLYLLAARRLGIAPQRCLALEDSVPGGRAARAAGMILGAVAAPAVRPAFADLAHYSFDSLADVATQIDALFDGHS